MTLSGSKMTGKNMASFSTTFLLLIWSTELTIGSIRVDENRDNSEAELAGGSRKFRTEFLQEWPTPGTGPYFDTTVPSNITGLVGKTVLLNCKVKNLGNRTVSWVRHRDIHLLTVGRYTYTSDQRFEAMHSPHTEEWTLRIRYAQRKDSGIYECQISTTPPIGHFVYLTIVEPVTEINGGPDLFINKGSTINLTCIVKYAPEPPPAVVWKHNRDDINFDSPRGGISLVTEKGILTTSRLLVQKAIASDSGLYTCEPSNANPASVRVHILNEHPAAMHHGISTILSGPSLVAFVLSTILLFYHHSIRWKDFRLT
ncbi:zwei Ig domain protein zig-8-like isoform X2 [Anopheles arabiensis]|uniref:Ig-like domain-containing protein n=1 Tax=Anopheles gambiae TaxID=7165 RepID=A0ABK8F353_ANOGA|nr:zwei Ig domain protein zig-8-like isoform X2 [Anopheles arabiensis]XP_041763166.1 zwei Ig domain protein zig-8-like isoform X2 [Anopheles merus]XP_061500789.1 zwei Ig domain protein zig-8 isoform X4 [Anopheles gambiae]